MTINSKQGSEGNFQEGARVPESDVLGEPRGYPRQPSEQLPVETIPTSVSHADILDASKKYGTDWEAK